MLPAALPLVAQRLALAALLFCSGVGTAAPGLVAAAPDRHETGLTPAEQRLAHEFHAALSDYEGNRWPDAYAAFVALADRGHVPATSLALRMHLHGAQRYGSRFEASAAQLVRWRRSLAATREP